MSELEEATIALGEALRNVEFGQRLQQWHPSRRGRNDAFGSLSSFEVNSGPAIRRTLQTLHLTKLAGENLELSDTDREYVAWIGRALLAIQRIAGRCWSPIPAKIRMLVCDEDDLGPHGSHYIPTSREHTLGPSLRFAGLDTPALGHMIDRLVAACRDTPCHLHAAALAERVTANPDITRRLGAHRSRTLEQLNFREKITIGEANERGHAVVRHAYEQADRDIAEIGRAFRAHNELVNYILFALLGLAETAETIVIDSDTGVIRCRRQLRLLWIHFATFDHRLIFAGHPPSPFILRAQLPIDGLYMLEGTSVRLSGRSLVDVHGRRLRELEEATMSAQALPASSVS